MRFSSWIGKDVLSRSGERLGYVVALRLTRDMKKLSCLVCADEEEAEFYLPARAVLSAEDAVIAGRQRFEMPTGQPCPVGRSVYLHTGEFFGVIADVDTGEEPALAVWTEDGERSVPAACAAMGETVIVYPTAEEKRTAGARRGAKSTQRSVHKRENKTGEPTVSGSGGAQTPAAGPAPASTQEKGREYRLDRTNLLGRRVKRSVFDDCGEPVALAGERITADVLARARRQNRLLALTVNTLTNLY